MAGAEVLSAAWAIASALGLAALAAFMLSAGRTRSRGELPFGLFALAWAIQVATVNLAPHVAEPLAGKLYVATVGASLAMPYLLVEFAGAYAPARARGAWNAARWTFGSLTVAGAALLALDPSLLVAGTFALDGLVYPEWTTLQIAIVDVPRIVAFGLALVALHHAVGTSPSTRTRNRTAVLLGGLSLYIGYAAGNNAVSFAPTASTSLASTTVFFVGFLALSLLVLAIGLSALRRFTAAATEDERNTELMLAAALLVPLAWGAAERALLADVVFQSLGLWRLAGVGVITYGLARWRIYDLPERVQQAAASSTGAAGALAGGATVFGTGTALLGSATLPALGGLLVTGLTALPGIRLARRVLGPSEPEDTAERDRRRFGQRIDAYRAAVEASISRGTLEQDRAFLAGLRERFDIDPGQARVVEHYAHDTVIPVQQGDPEDAYERIRMLGKGGAGRTWLARDRARDRLVVLKEPLEHWHQTPEVLDAARREAKLAAKVDHPHVVDVEAVVEHDDIPVLVIEHVAGGSLADRLREEGPIPWPRAVELVEQIARGLEAVHEAGIVHRDIKPANVLLTEDGTAKLTDFGIARERPDAGETQLLDDRDAAGTGPFVAPEVGEGAPADVPADVYGCAALLHACLAGAPPGEPDAQLPADLPAALRTVLSKGLARDPASRFESAEAFARALEGVPRP